MASMTLKAAGTATPELAWSRYREFALWSEWSPQIQSVESDSDYIGTGVTGIIHAGGTKVNFEITEVDEAAMTWSWRIKVGPIKMELDHAVLPTPDGCRTTLRVSGAFPVVAAYAPVAQLALGKLVKA